jgi:hypothetical protein
MMHHVLFLFVLRYVLAYVPKFSQRTVAFRAVLLISLQSGVGQSNAFIAGYLITIHYHAYLINLLVLPSLLIMEG